MSFTSSVIQDLFIGTGIFCVSIIVLFVVVAIPATLSLPKGRREGIESLNIDTVEEELRRSNKKDWELVAHATLLVHNRMQYCRRNSFDNYKKAFERGYGYC